MKYLKRILSTLPNITEGHADDLKIETTNLRLWMSREDNSIMIEKRQSIGHMGFKWLEIEKY